jgi:hypothetical protein
VLPIVHLIQRRFPGRLRSLGAVLTGASAAPLGVGAMLLLR